MSDSFSIIEDKDGVMLKRQGEEEHRRFKSEPDAIEEARRSLSGPNGEVTIFDPATGTSRVVKIDAHAAPSVVSA
jgi:hypothetical protein